MLEASVNLLIVISASLLLKNMEVVHLLFTNTQFL